MILLLVFLGDDFYQDIKFHIKPTLGSIFPSPVVSTRATFGFTAKQLSCMVNVVALSEFTPSEAVIWCNSIALAIMVSLSWL